MSVSANREHPFTSKFYDLTGQRFTRLTVVKLSPKRTRAGRNWLCQCDCGNPKLVLVSTSSLRAHTTRSCGCLCQKRAIPRFVKPGSRYGRLTAVKLLKKRTRSGHLFWLCKCKCGKSHEATVSNLLNKQTQSCGCLRHELPGSKSWSKKSVRAEDKVKAAQFDGGEWWYALRKAVSYMKNFAQNTIVRWGLSCVHLGGASIRTRQLPGRLGRITTYYAKESLDRVRDAIAKRTKMPQVPGLISREDAITESGCHPATLSRWLRKKGVKPKRIEGKNKIGRRAMRSYFPQKVIEEFKAELVSRPPMPDIPGFVPIDRAATELSCLTETLRMRMKRKKVPPRLVQVTGQFGKKKLQKRAYVPQWFVNECQAKLGDKPTANGHAGPLDDTEAPIQTAVVALEPAHSRPRKNKRGRPAGKLDPQVTQRKQELIAAWDAGDFGANKSAAGRRFGFDRSDANKIINGHENEKKCRN